MRLAGYAFNHYVLFRRECLCMDVKIWYLSMFLERYLSFYLWCKQVKVVHIRLFKIVADDELMYQIIDSIIKFLKVFAVLK